MTNGRELETFDVLVDMQDVTVVHAVSVGIAEPVQDATRFLYVKVEGTDGKEITLGLPVDVAAEVSAMISANVAQLQRDGRG